MAEFSELYTINFSSQISFGYEALDATAEYGSVTPRSITAIWLICVCIPYPLPWFFTDSVMADGP
jgi:hypothetical protein